MHWYKEALRNYADFSGRSARPEYWTFVLVNVLVLCVLMVLELAMGLGGAEGPGVLSLIFLVAIVVPSVAVGVRRLHDTGRSGWWLLVGLIPLIGGIAVFVLMLLGSDPATNEWGPGETPLVEAP
ncbi:MAG: DUF805 domain-containing protein [Acidobacteria bacterium]|nr:DUF805 domain-containing protein [Acidobacteriota bacterium]